jgi:HK97 family phage major capsid protein
MYDEHIENIKKLEEQMSNIKANAQRQGRELTSDESGLVGEMLDCIADERKHLPEKALTIQTGLFGGNQAMNYGPNGGCSLKAPGQAKDYKSLFGSRNGFNWQDKETNFFSAIFSGRHHPGLITNSMSETVQSDGGFLVPSETAQRIHAVSLENEIILPRCYVQPMTTNEIKIPAMSIGNHGVALFGGFTASYTDEAGTINEHNPKARSMELNAKKLTGLIRFSSELSADMVGGEQAIINICGKGLAWYRDKAFISGPGGGQPLGVLNSPCKVTVAKESGQKKETIVYENLIKMMSRMYAGSFSNSIWLCSQSAIPQLLSLSLSVGLAGSAIPAMTESNGAFSILTRPVLFTEKVPALGTEGDISLLDLSTYVVGLRSGMRFETSIHVAFQTDELLSRIIERHDGQSLWSEPLTLADGVTTVSPVVTLANRLV